MKILSIEQSNDEDVRALANKIGNEVLKHREVDAVNALVLNMARIAIEGSNTIEKAEEQGEQFGLAIVSSIRENFCAKRGRH